MNKLDKAIEKFIGVFSAAVTGILIVFTLILVVSRYFLHVNFQGWEETPIMMLVVIVWIAAILIARKDDMISIDLIFLILKKEKHQMVVKVFNHFVSMLIMAFFSYLSYEFVLDSITKGIRSSAVGFPMWPVHAVMLVGSVGMALAYLVNFILTIRRLIAK